MEKGWKGLPYHTIAEHYKKVFGEKVYKIPVTVVDTCPNRLGINGMQTCVFCDIWGSAAQSEAQSLPLATQIEKYKIQIGEKFKAKSFLVYFQAYTNTFTKISQLRENFELALSYPYVKGFVVGTRPDCISKSVLELWQEFNLRSFVAVELGVQSFFDDDLEFMKRGHNRQKSLDAISRIASGTNVDLGIHLIFGLPGESDTRIIETAKICNDLPITNIKLHNLHVLKETELEKIYLAGNFKPVEREEYTRRVELFLTHLHPRIALHRLAAFASRWEELIAPRWTADKMGTHQFIIDSLRANGNFQSKNLEFDNARDLQLQESLLQKSLPDHSAQI